MWKRIGPRLGRSLVASIAALGVSTLLVAPAFSQSAGGTRASVNVAVVPGFTPPPYSGYHGVPPFPATAPQLSAYHFTALAPSSVSTLTLTKYDTVILYGIRWADIPTTGQVAINAFARTNKVVMWTSDATGSQKWTTFIHPFSEAASGENYSGKPNDSVVSFPQGTNFLASDQPSSPYYLDPHQLVTDHDLINDMNAMSIGTANWVPALVGANSALPHGGWPLAWTYGVIGDHTGLTIYSGLDADAFASTASPNIAIKELAIELGARFETKPASCAPGCRLPDTGGGQTHASCSFAKRIPVRWVRGTVPIALQTSVASGVTGDIVTSTGQVIASGRLTSGNVIHLKVPTRKLPSNHTSRLSARVSVNGQAACSKPFRLKVDNTAPRILFISTNGGRLNLRVSESAFVSYAGSHKKPVLVAAGRMNNLRLPAGKHSAKVVVRDRAGNRVTRRLSW